MILVAVPIVMVAALTYDIGGHYLIDLPIILVAVPIVLVAEFTNGIGGYYLIDSPMKLVAVPIVLVAEHTYDIGDRAYCNGCSTYLWYWWLLLN